MLNTKIVLQRSHLKTFIDFIYLFILTFIDFREGGKKRKGGKKRGGRERERGKGREREILICCSTRLWVHWLAPVCV